MREIWTSNQGKITVKILKMSIKPQLMEIHIISVLLNSHAIKNKLILSQTTYYLLLIGPMMLMHTLIKNIAGVTYLTQNAYFLATIIPIILLSWNKIWRFWRMFTQPNHLDSLAVATSASHFLTLMILFLLLIKLTPFISATNGGQLLTLRMNIFILVLEILSLVELSKLLLCSMMF